ncbi:MAG: sporulation protein YqfD [Clostridia bacterium]|nr:sporulation protein YqfD [Clostridia bacterium]
MNVLLFMSGSRTVWADAENATALMDLCLRYSIPYSNFRWGEDGSACFEVSLLSAKRLEKLCRDTSVTVRMVKKGGLPPFLWRYRKRAGLMVGAVLAIILLVLSTRFVWDVRVTGNQTMTKADVLADLKACGFGVGSYIPDVRTEELETRVLIASDKISWIAVHMDGTVAVVQIIEHVEAPPAEDSSRPANLIATADGQIEQIELYRGNCVVKIGQAVKAGELLVSGLYDSAVTGYRYTRASGKILARTEHEFTVEIPLAYEEKVYGEAKCGEIVLNFFDFSLKIFKSTGNDTPQCDIIKEKKNWTLFGRYPLPAGVSVTNELPYTLQTVQRTPEEALDAAYDALEEQLAALSGDVQLLRKDVSTELTDTALILHCTVSCIENIAVQSEFEIIE